MRTPGKVLIGLGVIAGIVIVGLMLSRPGNQGADSAAQPEPVEPAPSAPAQPEPAPSSSQPPQRPPPVLRANGDPAPVPAPAPALSTNWEDKVDEILSADGATEAKAKQMLEMFPSLPEAGQVEVAKHLCNLVPDEDYAAMGQLLVNPQLPEDVLDTLMGDALNRPNNLKLPALLEVARTAEHPKAGDAKEVLEFFLEADYGDDWPKWQEKVQEWLKENPD